ncbi:cytochrome P450 [Streptomyces sp. SAI-135]|nr:MULTISPECIES: cytochrome P450 [unclassified Streptomyces]MDH6522873.1 cytochrome P450 [Streptomyces sp. SAI-090]MDH6613512.1 cytochrome P450 [Streptomyces sp. SAI-135]
MPAIETIPRASGILPLLGHIAPLARDPLAFVSNLHSYGPLVRIQMGTKPVVLVNDPAVIRKVLLDDRTFDKGGPLFERGREALGNGLITCPHSDHRRARRLSQPAFHPKRMAGYAATMTEQADKVTRSWHDGQVLDVTSEMMALTVEVTVRTLFTNSLPRATASQITDDFLTLMTGFFRRMISPPLLNQVPSKGNREYAQAIRRLRGAVGDLIAVRRADESDHGDLLSALFSAADPDSMTGRTDTELVDEVLTFLLAGTETTAGTLSWAMHLLSQHPEVERRVYQEVESARHGSPLDFTHLPALETTGNVVKETLRLYPAVWMLTRVTTSDVVLDGHLLPEGTIVAFSPYQVHRRADLYDEADQFVPDRWRDRSPAQEIYIPFSAGPRKCMGDQFALTQATLAVATVVSRWQLSPVTDKPLQPSVKASLTPRRLRLRVTARGSQRQADEPAGGTTHAEG